MHHDQMEDECLKIDKEIAEERALCSTNTPPQTLFEHYIKKLRDIVSTQNKIIKLEKEYKDESNRDELDNQRKRDLLNEIELELKNAKADLKKLEDDAILSKFCGPVTYNLEVVLNHHNIKVQAYHSRSFTGNHCNKYLRDNVYSALTNSIILKTKELTDNQHIIIFAESTAEKFRKLNEAFSKVHKSLSHCHPIPEDGFNDIDQLIKIYMQLARIHLNKIIPKHHILEHHCMTFVRKFGFGLGMLGEQGGEGTHREFNRLHRVMHGIANPLNRLKACMEEHLVATHPQVVKDIILPLARKRKVCD